MSDSNKFVCVHNRNRDSYEVPLALSEADLLELFVTDYYSTDILDKLLPASFSRRYKPGLPKQLTANAWLSFLIQYAGEFFRLPMQQIFRLSDYALGELAFRKVRRSGAHLYSYSSYLHRRPKILENQKIIDFEYHPNQELAIHILRADYKKYPSVGWSMAMEEAALRNDRNHKSWQYADAVVCASSMTKRSLEHVGCPENKITIIPYGTAPRLDSASRRPVGKCNFLFVGQGLSRKGLHHLAHAWRAISSEEAHLTVVSYRIDPGIAQLLRQAGITVLGRQSREQLDQLYATSDVFVMPSLVEGFGLVYLEALQVGCHVIGTQNTGLPDLALSDSAASVVDAGDIDGLIATLERLIAWKASNRLDPARIQAEANTHTWEQFRSAIAAHAQAVGGLKP